MILTSRVYGHFLVADIDPVVNANGELANRYLAAHRVGARPWDFIDLAVWGGQIIAGPGQHWSGKLGLIVVMWMGRREIVPILVLLAALIMASHHRAAR